MRSAILLCLFVIFGYIAAAQFTILPQLGFENSQTSIQLNDAPSFSPGGIKPQPQAGIRLDYKFKQAHGPYVGMGTSRAITKFHFTDPATAKTNYSIARGNTQLRMEAGYQVSSKPIYFKKPGSSRMQPVVQHQINTERKNCGNYMVRKSCGSKTTTSKAPAAKSTENSLWVRIQPSLGVAYNLFTPVTEIYTKTQGATTNYQYNAGNWKTAVSGGVGFEVGRNTQRSFALSVNYLKGISNLAQQNVTTVSATKPITTGFQSNASSWNIKMGIPFSIGKMAPVTKQKVIIEKTYREEKRCGQYKPRCNRVI